MSTPLNSPAAGGAAYAWPEGYRGGFCFSVDVDATSPYLWSLKDEPPSRLLGQMEQRLFGPRTGIWRILDLLDRYEIKGTFFVPGIVATSYPDLLPTFVEREHEIGLHGYFHELATQASDAEFTEALEASLEVFRRQVGIVPKGFRSPAWEMTPHMLREVKRHGFYDSSLMGFDHPYTLDGVTEMPVQWVLDDAIHFKFVGGGGDKWPPAATGPILESWLDEFETLQRFGGLFMLTVHDWISGRAHRIRMLERLLERVRKEQSCWIATVAEVAAHHAATENASRFAVPLETPDSIGARRFGRNA